jgi:hypothetical protein
MWDLGMQPSLSEAAANSPEVLSLLLLVFVAVVGLATGLVVIEAVYSYWQKKV